MNSSLSDSTQADLKAEVMTYIREHVREVQQCPNSWMQPSLTSAVPLVILYLSDRNPAFKMFSIWGSVFCL